MTAFNQDSAAMTTKPAKPKVIGLYGIPGSGKTTLLCELKRSLDADRFSFYEGSEILARVNDGDLAAFQQLDAQSKAKVRQLAIRAIHDDCFKNGKTAIVTGHFMFWREEETDGEIVCTENDLATYTHFIYMKVSPGIVHEYCGNDLRKHRDSCSVDHLSQWQQAELAGLSTLCRAHDILFSVVDNHQITQGKVKALILDFDLHNEDFNGRYAQKKLDDVVSAHLTQAETIMVIDGDRTLTSKDTGRLYYEMASVQQQQEQSECPLKTIFGSSLGYSYSAFRQATLLCEQTSSDEDYEDVCQKVASAVTLHSEFVALLRLTAKLFPVGAIIVSCGLLRVWEILIERAGLGDMVGIIAGGRIADGMVVTATVKAALVNRLRTYHNRRVWAFGDSPIDLEMLKAADQAVVVVIEEQTRSKSMEGALLHAIDHEGLRAIQTVIPGSSSPRLDIIRLPLTDITKVDFVNAMLEQGRQTPGLSISVAADTASKLLATPMRDAVNYGPTLRDAHQRTGEYLAFHHVSRIIGLEHRHISHVLGRSASGYQLRGETQTSIVSLMRGGDPMASGISRAFPRAMYVHVKVPQDIQHHHLKDQKHVILVDSVVNTGNSIIECVQAIRSLRPDVRIVVVTGVIQAQCLHRDSVMYRTLTAVERVNIIALRVSDTKFTGSGTTDTGNRLFNTTHLI